KIELALAPIEGGASRLEEGTRGAVDRDRDRQAARLARHIGGHAEELVALVAPRAGMLSLGAALLDAELEIEEAAGLRIDRGIARGDAAHARRGLAVAG